MDTEDRAALLEAVYDHYEIPFPTGHGNRKVKCPVHDESRPSASVDAGEGLFLCFACGAKGSGIDLVMLKENLDYADAVRFIEEHVAPADSPLRGSVRGKQGRGVHGRKGDRPSPRKYVPSWRRATE